MITASIVLYKTNEKQISAVLDSVTCTNNVSKIFIIDNAPSEKNKELCLKYNNIEYIENTNTGYGAAHNIALKKAIALGAKYHIILNSDIIVMKDTISELTKYMDNNLDVGYIMPKVMYPNGKIQYLCKLLPTPKILFLRRFLTNSKFTEKKDNKYILKNSGYDKVMNPPCLSGCFMFLRCSILEKNNLFFDERFFLYFEDFDLIRRIHKVSKTIFYPNVYIIHDHAQESYRSKKMLKIHIKSTLKYFNKWGWFFDFERNSWNKQILKEIETLSDKNEL